MKLPLVKQDKANHFIYGFAVYTLFNIFFFSYYSLGITFMFALGKEIYDEYKYKGFDVIDIIYTLLPPSILIAKETIIKK